MTYNADCLAAGRNTLEEKVDGVELRYRYLKLILELERRGKSERQIMEMVLPPGKKLRVKRRRISGNVSGDTSSQDQLESKKPRVVDWVPPSYLGSEDAWLRERDSIVATNFTRERKGALAISRERAEELLRMIEAIGCAETMTAWTEAVTQNKSQTKSETCMPDSTAKAICLLAERTEIRSFIDKILLRIGKWIFAMKIMQDVEKFRRQGAPSRSYDNAEEDRGGNAVTRALTIFMEEVHSRFQEPNQTKEREQEYRKYKKWWDEGQIWVALGNAVGAGILLLIPGGHCAKDGHRVSNKQ